MQRPNRKNLLGLVAAFVIVTLSLQTGSSYLNRRQIIINFTNISSVSIYKGGEALSRVKPLKTVTSSGARVKVEPGNYLITYVGAPGYASSSKLVSASKDTTVNLNPDYSGEHLQALMPAELPAITQALVAQYPLITRYFSVGQGSLYQKGDWYGTVLHYQGDDLFNSDNLRIVLHKQGDVWAPVTQPGISLNIIDSPNVPPSILQDVDQQT